MKCNEPSRRAARELRPHAQLPEPPLLRGKSLGPGAAAAGARLSS